MGDKLTVNELQNTMVLSKVSERLIKLGEEDPARARYLEQTSQFEDVVSELLSDPHKGRINKEADPSYSDLTDETALYIVMRDQGGKLEAFASLRKFEIGKKKFPDHLVRQYKRIYGEGKNSFKVDNLPFIVEHISGDVVFLSDIFISRTSTRIIDPSDLSTAAFCLAMLKWKPSWLYGFIKHSLMSKGIAARYRFTTVYPFAVDWRVATPNRRNSDWLLAMDQDELNYVIQSYRPPFLNEPLSGPKE